MVVYNRDLLDRAAIPYPTDDWTWDDFLRTAQLLTRDRDGDGRIDQWGAAFDRRPSFWLPWIWAGGGDVLCPDGRRDRKSTRLNSSHGYISYAVFCLKKKKKNG